VAFTQEPFSPILEGGVGSIELLEYSITAENLPDRQVYMASLRNADDDESDPEYDAELLADVSADERTVDAPQDENEEHRRIRRLMNAKRTQRRWNMENRARNPMHQKNLNNSFVAAVDQVYRTPIGAIAEAALLAQ
jgi:chromatin segregation and condensation protein Rec8/ScpA/Scc1 (kleisin family)